MGNCSVDEIAQGTQRALQRNNDLQVAGEARIKHAPVDVTIEQVTADTVVLTTAGEDNNKHQYRIAKSLAWLECPSTARSASDVGTLYISSQGLETRSNDEAQVRILGSTPDLNGNTLLKIKWPDSGATAADAMPDIAQLNIWPTSIVVKGYAMDDPNFHSGTVELLDPHIAGFRQAFQLSRGAEIALNLTPAGRGAFKMGGFDIDDLQRAVALVTSPFHDDAQERAKAWSVIARYRRFSDWSKAQADNARQEIEAAIDTAIAPLM